MRGKETLFGIFEEADKQPKPEGYRPRNHYKPDRDKCLAYRYYYYGQIHRMRYDDILRKLELEFFLTEHRLVTVLSDNKLILEGVVNEKPTVKQLAKLYPHWVWTAKKN